MKKKIIFVAFLGLACLAACSEQNNNPATKSTSNAINATKQRLDNLKSNANQHAAEVDSIISGNANNSNSQ